MQVGTAPDADVPAWPLIVPATLLPNSRGDQQMRATLEVMARMGLLTRKAETLTVKRFAYDETPTPRPVIVYTPTSKGEATFHPVERRTPSGMLAFPGMCIGRGEVVQIVRWTDPSDMFGATLTQVTYRYRATDVPLAMPAAERAMLETAKEAKVTLVRSSDGWQPADRL